jgi:hypothetical protein
MKKRSPQLSPALAGAPKQKKFKTIDSARDDDSEGWTKVEKRKQKKTKKAEVKADVCVISTHYLQS